MIDLANKEFRIIYISGYFFYIYIDNEYNIKILRNGTALLHKEDINLNFMIIVF